MARDPSFAPPLSSLATPTLGPPGVAVYPSPGQGFALDEVGRVPITKYAVGFFVGPTATGNRAVTDVGFQPKMVEFSCTFGDDASVAHYGVGIMNDRGTQWTIAINASGTSASRKRSTAHCISLVSATTTFVISASFVSMDTEGYTLNFNTVIASPAYFVHWKAWG